MAHRDDIPLAGKDMGLTVLDIAVLKLGRVEDQEQPLAVDLELGPLVGAMGILDGKVVETELPLYLA